MQTILLRPRPEESRYEVCTSLSFIMFDKQFTVPVGFLTDGASIPRFAWISTGTPFDPRHIRAAIFHDYLYQVDGVTRLEADALFRAILVKDGVSHYQAVKMYWALRVGGWVAWRRYRKRQGGNDGWTSKR